MKEIIGLFKFHKGTYEFTWNQKRQMSGPRNGLPICHSSYPCRRTESPLSHSTFINSLTPTNSKETLTWFYNSYINGKHISYFHIQHLQLHHRTLGRKLDMKTRTNNQVSKEVAVRISLAPRGCSRHSSSSKIRFFIIIILVSFVRETNFYCIYYSDMTLIWKKKCNFLEKKAIS